MKLTKAQQCVVDDLKGLWIIQEFEDKILMVHAGGYACRLSPVVFTNLLEKGVIEHYKMPLIPGEYYRLTEAWK